MITDTQGRGRRRSLWKAPALFTAAILSLLLLASHFVRGWHWRPGAFVVVSAIVFAIGFIYELVTRNQDGLAYRAAVGIAFGAGFMLLWGNLVQMADVNPTAALHFGVPVVGLIGAAVARLRPNGMACASFVTALAQALVLAAAVILLVMRKPQIATWSAPEWRGFGGNGVVVMLFCGSALLFRKAARDESTTCAVE